MIFKNLKNDQRIYQLIEDQKEKDKIFGELNTYIKFLLHYLWDKPNVVANLLSLSNSEDIKKYLAHFFANNFYENILSNNNKEDQLLLIITFLLKKEINKLNDDIKNIDFNNIQNIFLNETACGYIFEEFCFKKEIQSFFRIIILDLVEELELSYPSQEIIFDPLEIREILFSLKQCGENGDIIKNFSSNKKDEKLEEQIKLFNEKYQFGIPKEDLEKKLKENEKNQNKDMVDYIKEKISECSNNQFLFSTETFLENINFSKKYDETDNIIYNSEDERQEFSKDILNIYQESFLETIKIIDKLLDNLLLNIHLLPHTIKSINKIISILIQKKYPSLSDYERNIFISQFLFNKLLFPIFKNPAILALINEFIISNKTKENIKKIISVLDYFISGRFFKDNKKEGMYTPFNWYFLNKMPTLLKFFEQSKEVKLPEFIEKIIDKENIDFDYNYNYFEENKEEIVCMRNICYNIDEIYYLIKNIKEHKNIIFNNENNDPNTKKIVKAFEKIVKGEKKIDKIKQKIERISSKIDNNYNYKNIKRNNSLDKTEDERQTLNFFLLSDLIVNDKYSNLLNMKKVKDYFYIKEIKNGDANINNLIKIKNFTSALLYNYIPLDSIDLSKENENKLNTINILKEMKKYLNPSGLLKDDKIPSIWYINSIIEYLKKLNENLKENDYSEFYYELQKEIIDSIKKCNFEDISLFVDKTKIAKKTSLIYDKIKNIMIDIELNQEVQRILEKEKIPVEIKFSYSDDYKRFDIKYLYPENENYTTTISKIFGFYKYEKSRTIKDFTNNFPDITKYNDRQDLNIFKIIEELEIPQKIMKYFDYVGEHIQALDIGNKQDFNNIQTKINDYVMEKLYDKLFPKDPSNEDLLVYKNSFKCSWVELKHFVKGKDDYVIENFLPDTTKYFEQIKKEKSPRKKLKCVEKIFKCINYLALLNGDVIDGTDDSLPILNFAFIKACPFMMDSNCKYMKLFLGEKKSKIEGHQLSQLTGVCMQVIEFSEKSLFGVSEEEFKANCEWASNQETILNINSI